jgi:hypothetical protein
LRQGEEQNHERDECSEDERVDSDQNWTEFGQSAALATLHGEVVDFSPAEHVISQIFMKKCVAYHRNTIMQ